MLPLTKAAAVETRALSKTGEYAISTDGGGTHVSAMTLSNWAREVAKDIPGFQLKRVRSGVETSLAAAGVSKEIRGQLQSHGLSGVQARHYDAHDYLREKLAALTTLEGLLLPPKPKRRSASRANKSASPRIRGTESPAKA